MRNDEVGNRMIELQNSEVIPFAFGQIYLKKSCWIEGKPHFFLESIAEWLGNRDIKINAFAAPWSKRIRVHDGVDSEIAFVYQIPALLLYLLDSSCKDSEQKYYELSKLISAAIDGKLTKGISPNSKMLYIISRFCEIDKTPQGKRTGFIKELAESINKSVPTIHRWRKRFQETGHIGYRYHIKGSE